MCTPASSLRRVDCVLVSRSRIHFFFNFCRWKFSNNRIQSCSRSRPLIITWTEKIKSWKEGIRLVWALSNPFGTPSSFLYFLLIVFFWLPFLSCISLSFRRRLDFLVSFGFIVALEFFFFFTRRDCVLVCWSSEISIGWVGAIVGCQIDRRVAARLPQSRRNRSAWLLRSTWSYALDGSNLDSKLRKIPAQFLFSLKNRTEIFLNCSCFVMSLHTLLIQESTLHGDNLALAHSFPFLPRWTGFIEFFFMFF